jgi:prepilin-type N-terminal cleavage/methylation domain-containing protein
MEPSDAQATYVRCSGGPRRRAAAQRGRAGFALLEAIVASAIVGLVAVAAYGAAAADLRAAHRAEVALRASALAEYRLATVALLDAAAVRALPDSLARGRFAAPFADAQWAASSAAVPGEPALVDVTVRVGSPDAAHALHARLYRPMPLLGTP